jgi:hypothetical protein
MRHLKSFKTGNPNQVIDLLNEVLSKHETDKIEFFISEYLPSGTGYQIFLKGKHSDVNGYKFQVFNIPPKKNGGFPLELIFHHLNGKKKYLVGDTSSLERYLELVFNSREYKSLFAKMESVV